MAKNKSISIVVASFSSVQHLSVCLRSLQHIDEDAEIIVSTCFSPLEVNWLQQRYKARFIFNPEEQNVNSLQLKETRVFRLRSSGVDAAIGDIVILIEDHCRVASTWLQSMLAVLNNRDCIAGGPVDNEDKSSLYRWALYWSEYAAMMPPFPEGEVKYISAVNSAYYKIALDTCRHIWQDGFYDNEVHDALVKQGANYYLAHDAIVYTQLPFSLNQAVVHLFTGGQRYGGYRCSNAWNLRRIVRTTVTLLVPAVLAVRIFNIVRIRRPNLTFTYIMCLPVLLLLLTAWGAGELVGVLKVTNHPR